MKRAILLVLLLVSAAGLGTAQVSRVAGTLEGTVVDPSGAVVAGAQIQIRNFETGLSRDIITDAAGQFRATELPVGTYDVRAEYSGFEPYHHSGITIMVGQTVHAAIALATAGIEQQVTVTELPPTVDPEQTTLTTNIDTEKIEELPVVSRNYLNFVLLAPGVTTSAPAQSAGTTQAPPADSGFSFGGLRARSNNVSIDGVDNNDEYTGASRAELSLETIREFQVVNNGLSAESGGASGGAINVVTKNGTNVIHGDAFLFAQDGALNARDPFTDEPGASDFRRYRAGFAIGGPIRKDHTFYYTAFEQEHTRSQSASDIDPNALAKINDALASPTFARAGTHQLVSGFFPNALAETEASAKLSHQLTPRHSLMLRYAFTDNRDAGDAFNTGVFTDASARGSAFSADHALVGSLSTMVNATTINDLRFQLATRHVVTRNDRADSGPEILIAGVADFGRSYGGNSTRHENHYEGTETVSFMRGAHLLKAGITANHVHLRANVPDGFDGLYVFSGLDDFLAQQTSPRMFRQAFGDPRSEFGVTALGGFLQDHWTMVHRFTFDLGVRYDFEKLPGQFNQDTNNFSPRVGLAYSPTENWIVRAGYGIYFDRYILSFLNHVVQKRNEQVFEDSAAAEFAFLPNAGGSLPGPVTAPPAYIGFAPSIYRADPALSTPYSQQASLGIERLLTRNTSASATYLFARGVKLPRTVNVNLAPPVVALTLPPNEPSQTLDRTLFTTARLDPRYNAIYELQDRASSTYNGVSLALNRRLASEIAFSAAYTLSKTIDDASDFDEQPQNPYDLRAERALSRNDQRHRFVFSGLFDLPFGDEEDKNKADHAKEGLLTAVLGNIEVAPILTLASGHPVDPLVTYDAARNLAFPLSSRPLGAARNSLRSPATYNLDLRVLKYLPVKPHGKLDLVFELFNVFNRTNVAAINPFFGAERLPAANFGQPIEALHPRQAQFSIDFEF